MFVSFDSLQPSSRIWIYQSNRKFTSAEKAIISQHLELFTMRWVAHGQPLKSSFAIEYDQFIILAADEEYHDASGCSIDDSVRSIQDIGKQIGVDLFNRNLVAFKKDDSILLVPLKELKQQYHEGLWGMSTMTFHNLIDRKSQLENEWIIPSANTWLKRYVPDEKVAP